MPIDKRVATFTEAVADIGDGSVIMVDGFGGSGGMPQELILALRDRGARDLTLVSNTAGLKGFGTIVGKPAITHAILIENGQVRKVIASFPVGRSPSQPTPFELAYRRGEVDLEVVPQGTLAERIRSGGAGIAAFYTPTGVGTPVADGKEVRVFNEREYILEQALQADFALIRAHRGDRFGNLTYRGTSRNFNPLMAAAARVTIAEVDKYEEAGSLEPENVVTPGLYVQRIVLRAN